MRSFPVWRYFLLFATGGLYIFSWIRVLFDEINSALGAYKYNGRLVQRILLVAFFLEMLAVALLVADFEGVLQISFVPQLRWAAAGCAIALFVVFNICLVAIYRDVRILRGEKSSFVDVLLVVSLTFLAYFSLAFVQQQVDALPKRKWCCS